MNWLADPDGTLRRAAGVLTAPGVATGTRARAWLAAALAHLERGNTALARRAARRALPLAGPEPHLVLAWLEQDAGNTRASLRHLDHAQPHLHGALLARARCLRGLNLCVSGHHDVADQELSRAVTALEDDPHWLANALNARGVARTHLHRYAAATSDLSAAANLYRSLGEHERAATCVHNRGYVALQAGDVPEALRLFDAAVRAGLRTATRPEALIDRARALAAAGLAGEAAEILATVANRLAGSGRNMRLAEAWLALARCATQPGLALASARRAARLFRAQRRSGWLAAARSLELRLTGEPERLRTASRVARQCERHGFLVEAAELRLATGERDLLRLVQAGRSSGPPRLRALGWLARARLAALDGNRRGVLAACRAGLRTGADDGELAALGLATVLETGDPAGVLRWIAQVPIAELAEGLGARALLCLVERGGELLALSMADGRIRLHHTGTCRTEDVEALRYAVGAGVWDVAGRVAGRLDRTLFGPVCEVLGDRALVVVPGPGLPGMPWAALPSCAGRAVSVAPSVRHWLAASRVACAVGNPLWVAGPGLRHADREVAALHRCWGGRVVLSCESTVDKVRTAMRGADLVHVAAHGRYRAEAPAYSYLELADGALYGHELTAPVVVLSACEGALAVPLRAGTRAVVASTVPVADDAAVELMRVFYEHLGHGHGPAAALARAQAEVGDRGFVCVGAG